MRNTSTRIGHIVTLTALVIVPLILLTNCDSKSDAASTASAVNAASGQSPSTPDVKPELDYGQPLFTTKFALVCDQGLLLAAAIDRRADGGLNAIYDAFTAIWNRSEKIKKLGCQEWREDIPVFFAHRMKPPFDDFIGFGASPSGMAEYFTMAPHLKNKSLLGASPINREISTPTELEFNSRFRCPETYTDDSQSQGALAEMLEWYGAHHSVVTAEAFLAFRKKVLTEHHCDITLENLQSGTP